MCVLILDFLWSAFESRISFVCRHQDLASGRDVPLDGRHLVDIVTNRLIRKCQFRIRQKTPPGPNKYLACDVMTSRNTWCLWFAFSCKSWCRQVYKLKFMVLKYEDKKFEGKALGGGFEEFLATDGDIGPNSEYFYVVCWNVKVINLTSSSLIVRARTRPWIFESWNSSTGSRLFRYWNIGILFISNLNGRMTACRQIELHRPNLIWNSKLERRRQQPPGAVCYSCILLLTI